MNDLYRTKCKKHSVAVVFGSETGLFPAILGKGPWTELGKMIDLTAKLGEINDKENIFF